MKKQLIISLLFCIANPIFSQSLLDDIDSIPSTISDNVPVIATFKGTRLVNGHSVEIPGKKEMIFIIGHRFGDVSAGNNFGGLDQASTRIGLEYSPTNRLNFGLARSSYQKTVDGFIKGRIIGQSTGTNSFPLTIVYVGEIAWTTANWVNPDRNNLFSSRFGFSHQLLIARKMNEKISLQLMPTFIHKNLVPLKTDNNNLFAIGVGGRVKVSRRTAICGEYYQPLNKFPDALGIKVHPPVAIGVDVETGGHVFQLHFTNSQAMFSKGFISETTGNIFKGNIHYGFNITRVYSF